MPDRIEKVLRKTIEGFDGTQLQGLNGEAPELLSEQQKALMVSALILYMQAGSLIVTWGALLDLRTSRSEWARRSIASIDRLQSSIRAKNLLHPDDSTMTRLLELRFNAEAAAKPLSPEAVQETKRLINEWLDAIQPLEKLVNAFVKYSAKLQLANLGCLGIMDTVEDLQFAREFASTLEFE
jgi:hypothetical protein